MENVKVKSTKKRKRDLKIAEIIYYSIGGACLALGLIFSVFGVILLNPTKQNFEDMYLKQAEKGFFEWLHWDTTFAQAGMLLMAIAVVYFAIIFAIFTRKGDEIDKITSSKKSRQRQVVFTAPQQDTVVNEVNNIKE